MVLSSSCFIALPAGAGLVRISFSEMFVSSSDVSEKFPKDQLNSRQCIHNLEESVVGTESTSNTRDTLLINKEHASVNIHSEVSETTTTSELSAKNTQVNKKVKSTQVKGKKVKC